MNQTFKKGERLYLKRRFDLLLKEGDSFFSYPFRVIYLTNAFQGEPYPAQMAIAVRKKQYKRAVDRNRAKRLCREAYRQQKDLLYHALESQNTTMLILLVYAANEILPFEEINRKISVVINKLIQNLKQSTSETIN
ncbi:MAG: ribonuclease P protein component [Bacteroidales bacterium]|jgi:ribonuclease P protein component|nr:ribonuclease P protein component [Bacteroidales bacterium]